MTITIPATDRAVERGRRSHSTSVYGIRALAAIALLTVHVAMFSGLLGTRALGTPRPPSNFFGAFLVSGMPAFIGVFFVLPAMYLYQPLAKAVIAGTPRPAQGPNLIRRLLRLLPGYYAMWAVVLLTLNRSNITGLWYVLRPIVLMQVYTPSPFAPKLINGMEVTWTVPSMVQWYLVLPLIGWAVHRWAGRGATPAIRARRLMLPVPLLIAIGVGWLFFVKAKGWDNRIVFWWPQGFAPAIGIGMALAIYLALSQVSPEHTPRIFRAAATRPYLFWFGALVVYAINCARPFSVIGMDAIYSTSGLLMTYIMLALFGLFSVLPLVVPGARTTAVRTFLGSPVLAYLGKISYGIYLWHFAMMHFILQPDSLFSGGSKPLREMYGTSGFWALELLTFAGSVAAASLSHFLVEQPIAAWGDRLLARRRPERPDAAPAILADRLALPRRLPRVRPSATDLSADEATRTLADAIAQRDAIRSNLVDLERSDGWQFLSGATLGEVTGARRDVAAADLARLWELFTEYSSAVDDAAATLGAGRRPSAEDLARVTGVLVGPSVLVLGAAPPLIDRHITDDGRARLTLAVAIDRMNDLFGGVTALIATVETIWAEAGRLIDALDADLARVGPAVDTATAAAYAVRQRGLLVTDPIALWEPGRESWIEETERVRQSLAT